MSDEHNRDLSVIVPTYNYGPFLGPAISSVLEQVPRSRSVEIIVADDGSTDDTEDVVRALSDGQPVRYFRQENRGPAAARNLAMANARGRYLMLLDADDSLCPGCIEVTLGFLDRHPDVGLFFTNYDIYDESGVVNPSGVDTWKSFRKIRHREVADAEWVFEESLTPHIIRSGAFMHTTGLTLSRKVYEEIGPFQEGYSYAEDDEFYARAAWVTTAGYVDRVLSRKRNHAASLIHNPVNSLRNNRHLLELSEIQAGYYRGDAELQAILRRKIRDCAVAWCRAMIMAGDREQARAALWRYRSRYPRDPGFYRLLVRSFLPAKQS